MPATPMKDAAERYSPEMAEAFQPTDTERPATKKSCAVLDLRADQKPIQMVAMTVARLKVRIQGSTCMGLRLHGYMVTALHGYMVTESNFAQVHVAWLGRSGW